MSKKELPFDKYKHYLLDYLHRQNINVQPDTVCSCPWHEDSTPSFNVVTKEGSPYFHCFGCGRSGDIYKAVEYCTGETDAKKQFEEIERIYGSGYEATPANFTQDTKPQKPAFQPDPQAFAQLKEYLENIAQRDETPGKILGYFAQRAQIKSEGYIHQYPKELLGNLVTYFYWWPGAIEAEKTLSRPTLYAAGIPWQKKDDNLPIEQRRCAWYHPGVLAKSPEGFKLLFMQGLESKKINPRSGVSYFPIPSALPQGQSVILLEGEIDAILCQAAGITNAFSIGGKGGLSKPRIEKYIIPANLTQIILFADNDKDLGSQKKFGLIPVEKGDKIRETVPENLIKMGFQGQILATVLQSDCPYKDPDDAIRNGRLDLVQQAIKNAVPYAPPAQSSETALAAEISEETPQPQPSQEQTKTQGGEKKAISGTIYTDWDTVPLKFFKALLKKIPYAQLSEDEVQPVLSALTKTCKDDETFDTIISWANDEDVDKDYLSQAKKNDKYTPFYLLEKVLPKYEASGYYLKKLEELLIPAKELLRLFDIKNTIINVNYENAIESKSLQAFLDKKGNFSAASFLAEVTNGDIIYIIEDKTNYAYNGVKWVTVPDLAVTAHDILQNILIKYLEKHLDQKDFINKVLTHIDSRRFRTELARDFNGLPEVTYGDSVEKRIMFDSLPIRATLTLADGVMDFSGDHIRFRQAKREEFRRSSLPYTIAQIKKAAEIPERFLKLMDSNFKHADEETLKKNPVTTVETLMYYLSLIQSRDTSRRYGGFFLGTGGTGKSTLLKIIDAIYPNCTTTLNENILVSVGKHFESPHGPTPEMAKLEGKLFAYISETPEHGKLNETVFKRLTGGDIITARFLNRDPHNFYQTAQIGLASNNSPSFSHSETATIDRMMIFRFNVRHEKGNKDSKTPEELIEYLRPEFPAIVKYFANLYIKLNLEYKGKIPMSTECINEKGLYVDSQANDTDRFISQCLWFDMNNNDAFCTSKELYACYLKMLEITYNKEFREDSKETPSQRQFTTWLKTRVEFQNSYKQKRLNATDFPEWGFEHVAFTDYAKELMAKISPHPDGTLPLDPPSATPGNNITPPPPMPEDNPFDNDNGDDDYDIY